MIFINSMQAYLPLSLRSENVWYFALEFGGYDMTMATLVAFFASTLGTAVTFAVGYYASRWRDELPVFNEAAYQRVRWHFSHYIFLLLAVPPVSVLEGIPGVSMMPLMVMINGALRVPPKLALPAIAVSRILYYAYFLSKHH